MIEMIDEDGNIFQAEPLGKGYWYITWPAGGMRFYGTVMKVRTEMRFLMINYKSETRCAA